MASMRGVVATIRVEDLVTSQAGPGSGQTLDTRCRAAHSLGVGDGVRWDDGGDEHWQIASPVGGSRARAG